jgi:hypothetical protein
MNMTQYESFRDKVQKRIFYILDENNALEFLRGSWKFGDFHLNIDGTKSFSDLDLLIEGIDEKERTNKIKLFSDKISKCIDCVVSIHTQNSLETMNMEASQLLAIGEYISKYMRHIALGGASLDYIQAKFLLILLRKNSIERYKDVVNRIGNSDIEQVFEIKLGKRDVLDLKKAKKLIENNGDNLAKLFLNYCLINEPKDFFVETIVKRIRNSKTIDKWLRKYLIQKIYKYF